MDAGNVIAAEPRVARQIGAFAVVGAIGFAVDAGVFMALSSLMTLPPVTARVLAFLPATGVTWALNRSAVFRTPHRRRGQKLTEYVRYLLVQAFGIGFNFSAFYLVLNAAPSLPMLAPLAFGSLSAMVLNYAGARWLVFRR